MSSSRSQVTTQTMPVIDPMSCKALRKALAAWYARCKRDLPWRQTSDPYRIWVSEVMLQQTQVQTVIPYYHRFLAHFPDVRSLARADLQNVLKLWEGLGYYTRARNLHKAAGMVVSEIAGRIPDTWEALRCLPGIGDYIAAAVLSIAFGLPHAVVDGNVKRVLARLFLVDRPVNLTSSHRTFQILAGQLLDERNPGEHNQAMMELGALICTPRRPACADCPLTRYCQAMRDGVVGLYPKRDQRQPLPTRRIVAGVVFKRGKVLVVQRPEQGLLGGLWEFPAGPLAEGSDPAVACPVRIKSTVNLDVRVDGHFAAVSHVYTHFKLRMEVYRCRWQSGRVRLNGYIQSKWLSPDQIVDLPLHGAMHKALAFIRRPPA